MVSYKSGGLKKVTASPPDSSAGEIKTMPDSKGSAASKSNDFLPFAFYFQLKFSGSSGKDTSFQEVSGIGSEIDVQEVVEGGENEFVHRLPKGVKHPLLSLKRGIADLDSPLVKWCKSVLEGGFAEPIETQKIDLFLLNREGDHLRAWSFKNAYPVKWEIDSFNSTKHEVAIEKIEISSNSVTRENIKKDKYMSIEINELVVNATIDDSRTSDSLESRDDRALNHEELKAEILSECKELFYELLDKHRDR